MQTLGLDPSLTNFGWAVVDLDAVGLARVVGRGRFATPASAVFIDRYTTMQEELRALLRRIPGVRVGIEYPVFGEMWSEGMYGLFLMTMQVMRQEKRDVVLFTPMQAKAQARHSLVVLGKRPPKWKMDKPDMVEAAKVDTGGKGSWNHNEADAYWVAHTAARFWSLFDGSLEVADLTPPEQKHFTLIHTFTKGPRAGMTVKRGIVHREDSRFFLWAD